jgi:hypothetical protein
LSGSLGGQNGRSKTDNDDERTAKTNGETKTIALFVDISRPLFEASMSWRSPAASSAAIEAPALRTGEV